MRERAMWFGAALAATLALGGAALGSGAGRLLGGDGGEASKEQAWRARAEAAGKAAAALAAQEACSQGRSGKPSAAQARQEALCQLERGPGARPVDGERRLAAAGARERERREEFMELALSAYKSSTPFDGSEAALAPTMAISEWQQAELAKGRPAPLEAAQKAEEALARLDRAIQEELAAGRRADGGFWVFKIAPGALDAAKASGERALALHWQTLYPESLKGAQEMLAAGEAEGMEALRRRSGLWASERVASLLASAEAHDPEASAGAQQDPDP